MTMKEWLSRWVPAGRAPRAAAAVVAASPGQALDAQGHDHRREGERPAGEGESADRARTAHLRDVKYEKGATTRCLRTVDLDQGRRVMIGATVTITDTSGGGHY